MDIEFHDNSAAVRAALKRAALKTLEMCGGIGESAVKQRLTDNGSVDTGLLRNSITYALGGQEAHVQTYQSMRKVGVTVDGQRTQQYRTGSYAGTAPEDDPGQMSVYIGTNVEYAPHLELGTVKMNAKPYLRPAIESCSQLFERAYALCFRDLK